SDVPNSSVCRACQLVMAGTRNRVRGDTYLPSASKPPWQRTPPAISGSTTGASASSSSAVNSTCPVTAIARLPRSGPGFPGVDVTVYTLAYTCRVETPAACRTTSLDPAGRRRGLRPVGLRPHLDGGRGRGLRHHQADRLPALRHQGRALP